MERERKRLEQFRQARGSDSITQLFCEPLDLAARLVIGLHPLTQAR